MEIPEGFPGAGDPGTICKINCALYGLKQSQKAWKDALTYLLKNQNHEPYHQDEELQLQQQQHSKSFFCTILDYRKPRVVTYLQLKAHPLVLK
jgi:hypothetical protein